MITRAFPFLLLLTTLALPGQETGNPAPSQQRPPAVVVTLSFRGGTMAELVAALRAAEPKANIVVASAAATAKVPAIELRGAGIGQALDGACMVAEAVYPVRVKDFTGPGEPVYSVVSAAPPTMVAGPGGGMPTATSQMASVAKPDDSTQVFSLNRLTDGDPRLGTTEGFKVETILSAIEAGTADDAKKAVLRYHRDSGLLFLRGTRAQISIVKDLLSSLERDLEERRRRIAGKAPPTMEPPAKDGERKD